MQYLATITLAFAAISNAAPLESRASIELRQADAIKSALMPVMKSLTDLDTAIKGLTTDPNTAAPILSASQSASSTLGDAATKINAADDLGIFGALGLQQTGTDLATMVQTTITDLMAKKPVLDQLGVTSVAVQSLQQQKSASGGLSTALLSKVPAIAKPIAKQSTDKIGKALDDGIAGLSAAPAAGAATTPATGTTPTPASPSGASAASAAARRRSY